MYSILQQYNRIANCGTHGVGKTTLAKHLSGISDHKYIPEVARELLDVKGKGFTKLGSQDIIDFQSAVFFSHIFMIRGQNCFISDRSIIDHFVYLAYHVKKGILHPNLLPLYSIISKKIKTELTSMYDLILYYSPEGITLDKEQREIDNLINRYLSLFHPDYMSVDRRTISGWSNNMVA